MERSIAKSYVEERAAAGSLVAHQIDSYNDFIVRRLQKTLNDIGKMVVELPTGEELVIKLGKVTLNEPQMKESDGSFRKILPQEARYRNLTYSTPVYVEMTPVFEEHEHDMERVEIGELPIMVKSKLCHLANMSREELIEAGEDPDDHGGYFIINGTERTIILSEEIAPNKLILQKEKGVTSARINSERGGYTQRHMFERTPEGLIVVRFANLLQTPVSVVLLMKALGIESDKEVIEAITTKEDLLEDIYINIYENQVANKEEALEYIGKKMKMRQKEGRDIRIMQIIDNYLLAHIGTKPEHRIKKAKYLGDVFHKMILLQKGLIDPDDIDHYANKRLRMAGDLLETLVRSVIMGRWGLVVRLQYNYQKMMKRGRKLLRLQSVVVADVFTKQVMRAMSTGTWVGGQTGVSQRLERSNFIRTLGHMRSVVSPLSATQEHFEARELHATQWGRLCAVRTPEGQSIGLRNFLALSAQATIPSNEVDETKIVSMLKTLGAETEEN